MDRELIEKVTHMVIASVEEMKSNEAFNQQDAVKLWPHVSPMLTPVMLPTIKEKAPESLKEMVKFPSYM